MKCLIPFFNLNQGVCTIQDFHEITIMYSSKCHVFRVMSPDCKTFFFLPMRYIQLAPVIRLLLGLTRLDSCTLQCYTRAKTYKKTANTGEIRTPFGVNYDSSKRKVRVLHFFSIRYTREIKSLPLYLYLLIRIYSISILLRISNSIIESTYKLFNMKIFMFCIFLVVVDITTTSGNLRRKIKFLFI